MNNTEIYDKIMVILMSKFNLIRDEIKPESDLRNDLDLDSIDVIDVVTDLEQECQIEVSDFDLWKIEKVNDLHNTILKYLN